MIVKQVPISKINPATYNPRKDLKPEDAEYQRLLKSIAEFGCVEPLVWNRRTETLVGGHQRFKILVARGATLVDVSVVDLSIEREKALNLALNKIHGEWDERKLALLLEELTASPTFDIEVTGFDVAEIGTLVAGLDASGASELEAFDHEAAFSDAGPAVTRPGELIDIGPHRLLCGDATQPKDIARLLDDRRARLLFSDPPYNVNYTGTNRPSARPHEGDVRKTRASKTWDPIHADHQPPSKYARWLERVVAAVTDGVAPGAAFYLWNSHANFPLLYHVLRSAGLRPSCVITWAKESFSPGFGDYNEQTEFCLYGWKRGARRRWYGPKNETTLWDIRRDRTQTYYHPTQKALALAERAIRNSSRVGDLVFDPFLGSGTTLIAAARLGRRCAGIEIEPKYCDVAIRRLLALVGASAVSGEIVARYTPMAMSEARA